MYTFENRCIETGGKLAMGDGTRRIFLNADGRQGASGMYVPEGIVNLMEYIKNHEVSDKLTEKIEEALAEAINDEEGRQMYMTLWERDQDKIAEGRAEGRAEGEAIGKVVALASLVHDGIMTADAATERAEKKYGIKREDFQKMLENYKDDEDVKQG